MSAGRIHVYLVDPFADWEAGLLMAELKTGRHFSGLGFTPGEGFEVVTVSTDGRPVTSMGGLQVTANTAAAEVQPDESQLLVLVGGAWQGPAHRTIVGRAADFLAAGVPVAAICGGSEALAGAGLLNDRTHTSNNLDLLRHSFPGYAGEASYQPGPVVTDGDLITATGVAPVEFAEAVLKRLGVMTDETLAAWTDLYTHHRDADYFRLMASLPKVH